MGETRKYSSSFIRAYHDFRKSVDFGAGGILPELNDLIWCMLVGVPEVPADQNESLDSPVTAIEQRVAILKAIFVEINWEQEEEFIDQGLLRYDQASRMAKDLLKEACSD